jgi:hypothetical protein
MRCEEILEKLNARMDGALNAADTGSVEEHLDQCESCRAVADGLQGMDADLRRAFLPRRAAAARVASNAVAQLRATTSTATVDTPPILLSLPRTPSLAWGQMLTALAAGFLLAVALFRPWRSPVAAPEALPPDAPIARLAVATGPVEVQPAAKFNMAAFLCPQDGPIERDSVVRTGPGARAEIALADGSSLWLDYNTEVTLREAERVEVNQGRAFGACSPGHKGLEIQSAGGTAVASEASQLAVECRPFSARYMVCEGGVNVQAGQKSVHVGPNRQVHVVRGDIADDPANFDALLETSWINGVLALRGSDDPELAQRVNQLLANVGAAKLSLLYEDELRRLGDSAVPPLLAYLASTRDMPDLAQRATAARIVADVAETRWIADLIALLADANPAVRFQVASGLKRLTGRDQGCEPQTWQTASWDACEGSYRKWLEWWDANRELYPAARRHIPVPTSPPF